MHAKHSWNVDSSSPVTRAFKFFFSGRKPETMLRFWQLQPSVKVNSLQVTACCHYLKTLLFSENDGPNKVAASSSLPPPSNLFIHLKKEKKTSLPAPRWQLTWTPRFKSWTALPESELLMNSVSAFSLPGEKIKQNKTWLPHTLK